jgi:hypothetical protein
VPLLAVGLLSWMPGFEFRLVHVGFLLYEVALRQIFIIILLVLFHQCFILINSSITDTVEF